MVEFSVPALSPRVRHQVETFNTSTNINVPPSIVADALSTRDNIGLVFTYYSNSSLFPLNLTKREIPTPVIGASLTDESANSNLNDNVSVNFQLPTPVN